MFVVKKMTKTCWSAVNKNVKISQVRSHKICQKHKCLQSQRMQKTRRSAVTKNAKILHDHGHNKMTKLAGAQSRKHVKISQVCRHKICQKHEHLRSRKMPKTRRSDRGHQKCQKLTGPRSRENDKTSQVCGIEKIPKTHKSTHKSPVTINDYSA